MKRLTFSLLILLFSIKLFAQDINSQLFAAVLNQNFDSVKILIKKGADVNAINIYGITPLLYAVDLGNYQICNFLLEKGANPNYIPPYDPPALSMAIINNRDSILSLLLKYKANPNILDKYGYTPLTYAIYYGNYLAADLLLYLGANPNQNFANWTPLELASYYDDTLLVKMLLFYGANPNQQDSLGYSALHICAQNNCVNSASILLENGANPNINSKTNGLTPLVSAIFFRNNKILDTLIKYKAKINLKILNKYTPTSIAVLAQNYPAKRKLKKLGSPPAPLMFDIILGTTSFVNFQNIFVGIQVGLKELNSNIDLTFEMAARPTPKRVLFSLDNNNLLQLWEQRWFMSSKLSKNFFVFSSKHKNYYFRTSLLTSYTYANYRGSLRKNANFLIIPELGWGCDFNYFTFNIDFARIKLIGLNNPSFYLNFTAAIKLSPYKLDIMPKKFILRNEPVF